MEYNVIEPFTPNISAPASELSGLVRRAQAGEQRAFDALLLKFQDMAVGYCAAILGDFQLAEDTAQEAFLETYRILPAIRIPDAFPAYLRLTLRKHCDRLTRRKQVSTVALEAAFGASSTENLPEIVEAHEWQNGIRAAVRSLPESERTVVLLFYIGQRSLKEVSAFLEVPISTVKNRLYTARRKLRKRMLNFMEETIPQTIGQQRPSNSDEFRGQIISRLFDEYRRQFGVDKQSANRSLLEQAHAELNSALTEGILDAETVRAGAKLLMGTDDYGAFPDIMDNYLTQRLPLAEEFWAKWTRIRGLAFRREADAVVTHQRDLMEFVRTRLPGDPPVRLSAREPFAPTDDPSENTLTPDSLPIFALGIVEIGMCYRDAGLLEEWLALVLSTLDSAPKTSTSRLWRFFQLRHAIHMLDSGGDRSETSAFLERIRALADEEHDWQTPRWPIEALYMKMRMLGEAKDAVTLSEVSAEAVGLLNAFQASIDPESGEQRNVLRTLTNNIAAALTTPGTYDLALPLWERLATNLPANDWSYLCYAQCVWATSGNRERTLKLLREAAACSYDGGIHKSFTDKAPAFAAVRNDPEFLAAIESP